MRRRSYSNVKNAPMFQAWHENVRSGAMPCSGDPGGSEPSIKHIEEFIAHIELAQIPKAPLSQIFPRGHILHDVIDVFYERSLIPVEIPIWTLLILVAQYLGQRGVSLELDLADVGGRNSIKPNLWVLLFASSASGKSLIFDSMKDGLGEINVTQAPASTAKFRDQIILSEGRPTLLLWDEFGQDIKMAKSGRGNFLGLQKLLINAYNGEVGPSLANGGIQSKTSAQVSLLALSQGELISDHFSWQDWSSGLMQRFTFVYAGAQAEPISDLEYGRKIDFSEVIKTITSHGFMEQLWSLLCSNCIHVQYHTSDEIIEFEHRSVGELRRKIGSHQSFLSRSLFTARKLALVLHILSGNSSQAITMDDAKLAWSLIEGSLHDLKFLSDTNEQRCLVEAFNKAEIAYSAMSNKADFTYSHLISRTLSGAYKSGLDKDVVRFIHKAVVHKNRNLGDTKGIAHGL